VKTQVWIAVCAHVLVALVKKRLNLELNLYTILQILSVTLFERMPVSQALSGESCKIEEGVIHNQLQLFNI
jgi:hypothetical protein